MHYVHCTAGHEKQKLTSIWQHKSQNATNLTVVSACRPTAVYSQLPASPGSCAGCAKVFSCCFFFWKSARSTAPSAPKPGANTSVRARVDGEPRCTLLWSRVDTFAWVWRPETFPPRWLESASLSISPIHLGHPSFYNMMDRIRSFLSSRFLMRHPIELGEKMFILWVVKELLITSCHNTKLSFSLSVLLSRKFNRFLSLLNSLWFNAKPGMAVMCPFFLCVKVFQAVRTITGCHNMDHSPHKNIGKRIIKE